jgi:predicted amidohydrolase
MREAWMRLGAVTLCTRRGEKQANLDRIVRFGERAAQLGCRLVGFPEFSVNGPWVTYDPDANISDLERDAETIPGPTTDRLTDEASRLDMAFGVGIAELGLAPKPFNAYVIVGPEGVLHVQRKLQPTESEMAFYRGGGDDMSTFVLEGISFGVTLCADNESPAIHERLYKLGARVILEPHYDCAKKFQNPGGSWEELLDFNRDGTRARRARALAERLAVTAVYVDAKDPRQRFDDHPEWPHYVNGKSAVFGPGGELLAENAGNEESLLTVDI